MYTFTNQDIEDASKRLEKVLLILNDQELRLADKLNKVKEKEQWFYDKYYFILHFYYRTGTLPTKESIVSTDELIYEQWCDDEDDNNRDLDADTSKMTEEQIDELDHKKFIYKIFETRIGYQEYMEARFARAWFSTITNDFSAEETYFHLYTELVEEEPQVDMTQSHKEHKEIVKYSLDDSNDRIGLGVHKDED